MLDAGRYRAIAIERRGGIALLTLSRPERLNAVDDLMHSELSTVFHDAQADASVNVVVLTGAGRAFSAGGDTSSDRAYETVSGRAVMDEARHIVDDIVDLEKPLIAAVNGHAIGLGATLATLADISFMADGAKLGDPHVLAALPAGNGSAVIWPLLVGLNRAKHLLMTGDLLTAVEAERFGLVTRVLPAADVVPAALELAARFDSMAPQALRGTKIAINRLLRLASDAVLPLSLALEDAAMRHPDFAAALAALSRPGSAPATPDGAS